MEAIKAQSLLPIEVAPRAQTGYIGICEGCQRQICTLERLTAKGVLR